MNNPYVTMTSLTVAAIGTFCTFGVFWTLADCLALRHCGGRRDRTDQLDRQSRRIRRAVSDRLGQGDDRQYLDGPAGARRAAADRRTFGFFGGHETKAEFAGARQVK